MNYGVKLVGLECTGPYGKRCEQRNTYTVYVLGNVKTYAQEFRRVHLPYLQVTNGDSWNMTADKRVSK